MQFFMPMHPPTVTHQAKALHAYIKDGKPRAVLHDTPELKSAHVKLRAALAPYRPPKPIDGAVELVVKWLFPCTGRHRDGQWKTTKPDTDNLTKALKDQMTSLGFWQDDAQVASEITQKFWAQTPGIFVRVTSLEEAEP